MAAGDYSKKIIHHCLSSATRQYLHCLSSVGRGCIDINLPLILYSDIGVYVHLIALCTFSDVYLLMVISFTSVSLQCGRTLKLKL